MVKKFKRSETTAAIVRYLAAHDKGTQVSYSELSKAVGQIMSASNPHLTYARKILVKEHAQVWGAVHKVGLKRLDDQEMAERQKTWFMRTAGNKLRNGKRESEVVDIKQLAVDELARFGVHCLQQHLAAQALTKQTYNKLEKVARGNSNDLPSLNILEWSLPMMSLKSKRK